MNKAIKITAVTAGYILFIILWVFLLGNTDINSRDFKWRFDAKALFIIPVFVLFSLYAHWKKEHKNAYILFGLSFVFLIGYAIYIIGPIHLYDYLKIIHLKLTY